MDVASCAGMTAVAMRIIEGAGNGIFSLVIVLACLWFMDRRFNGKSKES